MMLQKEALIIEDDRQISSIIKSYMERDGWNAKCAFCGKEGTYILLKDKFDLIILDLMLGDKAGEVICEEVRKKSDVPIIIISARSREQDKLNLFYIGADDYVTKPFSVKELMARVNAVMRRCHTPERDTDSFDNGNLLIDYCKCSVCINDRTVELTSTEFKLVSVLANKPDHVFSRGDLVYYVLNCRYAGDGRIIDAHVKNIRKKFGLNLNHPQYIKTVIGIGYKFGGVQDNDCKRTGGDLIGAI